MIVEWYFIIGMIPGFIAGLMVGYYWFKTDDFTKRQERYKRMI